MGWPGRGEDLGNIVEVGFLFLIHTIRSLPAVAAHTDAHRQRRSAAGHRSHILAGANPVPEGWPATG